MKLLFLNPQGNFDFKNSMLAQHPDFGGQLVYVREVASALADIGISVDIVTRRINEKKWECFSSSIDYFSGKKNPRIIRVAFGGDKFLNKELLWPYIKEYSEKIMAFYKNARPDFITTHYGDGGLAGVYIKKKWGIPFSFTAHSLGAQKLLAMGTTLENFEQMDKKYKFSVRIAAERLSIKYADKIIVSTELEKNKQYFHKLYEDVVDETKFEVIPPGINTQIFGEHSEYEENKIRQIIFKIAGEITCPCIVLSSRLDEKKNHISVVKAYIGSDELKSISKLVIILSGIENPYDIRKLDLKEQYILEPIIRLIKENKLEKKIIFLNISNQKLLAGSYRFFALLKSVFCLPTFYEPFGLATLEAAACGLVPVTTENGGQKEVFSEDTAVFINPFDIISIQEGLIRGLKFYERFSAKAKKLILRKYTWQNTANLYLKIAGQACRKKMSESKYEENLMAKNLILSYLAEKE